MKIFVLAAAEAGALHDFVGAEEAQWMLVHVCRVEAARLLDLPGCIEALLADAGPRRGRRSRKGIATDVARRRAP